MKSQNDSGPSSDMSVAALLTKDLIRLHLPHRDKQELMGYLVRELCASRSLADCEGLLKVMLERESEGIATTLDTGLSLPHARIDGLARTAAILGIPAEPIPDPKQKDYPIRAMFLFFSPNRAEAYTQQLQLLRDIALLFQDDFLDRLARSSSPEQTLELIQNQEASIRKS